tara:strand:- start:161 stop:295 length:135 start_codon:yes stop_codon:yes gene_type:complete
MSKKKLEFHKGQKIFGDIIINDPCVWKDPRIVNLDGVDIYSGNE